jgi:hypothetical protein
MTGQRAMARSLNYSGFSWSNVGSTTGTTAMLSFLYRLCQEFESEMGYAPNVLFINPEHLEHLRESFDGEQDLDAIRARLGLEILLRSNAVHPSVNWLVSACRKAG